MLVVHKQAAIIAFLWYAEQNLVCCLPSLNSHVSVALYLTLWHPKLSISV